MYFQEQKDKQESLWQELLKNTTFQKSQSQILEEKQKIPDQIDRRSSHYSSVPFKSPDKWLPQKLPRSLISHQNQKQTLKMSITQFYKQLQNQIMNQKIIKKQGRKNTNVPKFLIRLFLKYFPSQVDFQVEQHFKEGKQYLKTRKFNNYNINDLNILLGSQNMGFICKFNRSVIRKILRQQVFKQVFNKKYISSNRKTYLLSSKVFALRCKSKSLVRRVQFR